MFDTTDVWPAPAFEAARDSTRARTSVAARFDLASFATWLPRLGAVLCLDRPLCRQTPVRAVSGTRGVVLLEHPVLQTLGHCTHASAHTQLTSLGPREWLGFRDAAGELAAKLYLLPDTDYLAWDEMIVAAGLTALLEEPARWNPQAACLRTVLARFGAHWNARVLTFQHRRLPWLQTLDARPPLRLSLLGHELARAIARGEGADFAMHGP